MKKASMIIALAACLALALPALAGEGHGCTASTQDCLNMMATHMKNKGWLGVELEKDGSGLLAVTRVVPGSPAEEASRIFSRVACGEVKSMSTSPESMTACREPATLTPSSPRPATCPASWFTQG